MRSIAILLAVPIALAAAGCDRSATTTDVVGADDPALSGALGDPIMIDPDLVAQNRANSVAALPSQDGSLPTVDNNLDAIAAARADALRLVGGPGRMRKAPEPRKVGGELPAAASLTAMTRAAAAPAGDPNCAERAEYTMQWAARLPAPFPVYPRAAAQEAAGTDTAGCSLRVVNFVTPVPLGEVMDFYFTRARAAGFTADRVLQDGDDVLAGTKGGGSYVVYARELPSGLTEVDLVTGG